MIWGWSVLPRRKPPCAASTLLPRSLVCRARQLLAAQPLAVSSRQVRAEKVNRSPRADGQPAPQRQPRLPKQPGFYKARKPGRPFVVEVTQPEQRTAKEDMGKLKAKEAPLKAGTCYIQVLGLGTDTGLFSPSVLLFFDQHRYLFNAGEGLQRFCAENKIRPSRLSGVFITRCTPFAMGGLPGMCLTVAGMHHGEQAEATGPAYAIHGPQGLKRILHGCTAFADARFLRHQVTEFLPAAADAASADAAGPAFANDLVKITPVLLPAQPEACDSPAAKRQRTAPSADHQADVVFGQHLQAHPDVACYVCELPEIPGKFQPARAIKLGVPKGPLWGQLQRGATVVNPTGASVQASEVLEAATPGPTAMVIDCPDVRFLAALTSSPGFAPWQQGGQRSAPVLLHLSPANVLREAAYQEWMHSFGDQARHVLVNAEAAGHPAVFKAACGLQARLNLLHGDIFPLQWVTGHARPPPQQPEASSNGFIHPRNLTQFHLRPAARIGSVTGGEEPLPSAQSVVATLAEQLPETHQALVSSRLQQSREASTSGRQEAAARFARDVAEVVVLGTGAATPSKYRNVTGVYLDLFERGSAFLDCGEGSLNQLALALGPQGAAHALAKLRFISISHIHADHHVGVIGVLQARRRILGPDAPPLPVLGPCHLLRALQGWNAVTPLSFHFIDCREALAQGQNTGMYSRRADQRELLEKVMAEMQLTQLLTFYVEHCSQAFGIMVEGKAQGHEALPHGKPTWKLAFSGDCRPCEAVITNAQDADLLIHEATFEDALLEEALAKKHSLTKEAVEVGRKCGAFRTLLTHFSQRYPKIPIMDPSLAASTCIASDLMRINLADLEMLPSLVPLLKLLFAEELAEAEADATEAIL